MKIAIVGTGAMGSVYAALLADAGNEVWAIDAWPEHVQAMREKGLRLTGKSGDRTVKLHASTNAADAGRCDLVIIATKAMQVRQAAESVKPLIGNDTAILSIQNGLGGPDTAAEVLGRERVSVGVVGGFGASMQAPGFAHHNGMELVRLGELDGPATKRLERVAEVWRQAGFTVKTFDDVQQLVWEKLVCNTAFSGTCCITGLTVGEVIADANAWPIAHGCATEAFAVAKGKRIHLEFDDPVAYVRDFGLKIPKARPSMLLDHLAGRPCEIEVINGAIPRVGKTVGVPTPINDFVVAVVKAREAGILRAKAAAN